jgi:sulfur carrier protein
LWRDLEPLALFPAGLLYFADRRAMSRDMMQDQHVTGSSSAVSARHTIALNGETIETTARTLAELVAEAGFAGSKVATALNGEFVAERDRGETRLSNGDRVEIVAPRQGG